jgi:hypothetical protein
MADATLTFAGWTREKIADLVTGSAAGRATGTTSLVLTGTDAAGAGTGSRAADLTFSLAGPGDVLGLSPAAISRRYPTPGAADHESDRCPLVEFADSALPWRYTPGPKPAAGTGGIHPWLVLLVGTADELVIADDRVTVAAAVQQAHPLGAPTTAYPWAHVQTDAARHRIGRVLSGRALQPGTDYVAALVPAFHADASPSWDGTAEVTVQLYDSWQFRTAVPAGSFEELAAALHPGDAPTETGRAPLDYPRLPAAPELEVRGALAPIDSTDAALPTEIGTDLEGLRTPATDEVGRPIVGLPRYGDAWRNDAPDVTTWGGTINRDPRHRGVAGLGLELGIRLQDELVQDAVDHLGALAEARQKISFLVLGLAASGTLWNRRLPTTDTEQLWVLGPALGRVATATGTVRELSTATDRALPAGVWSTAARRVLRSGPARAAASAPSTFAAGPTLDAANVVPPPPPASFAGVTLPHTFDGALRATLQRGAPAAAATNALAEQAVSLAARAPAPAKGAVDRVARQLDTSRQAGKPVDYVESLVLIAAGAIAGRPEQQADLSHALDQLGGRMGAPAPSDAEQLATVAGLGAADPLPEPPITPVDLTALAGGVAAAFDPTAADAAVRTRVLGTVGGLDPEQPLAPPETCVGIDRPIWRDVNGAFPEWLLPGLAAVPDDAVIALQTNTTFVHALLLGMNTQLLNELRWRNIPVATGCTPLRGFWQRADSSTGDRVDDITGVLNWPDPSDLGDPAQRPPGLPALDLVIAVRGRLFLRYPATVVYLTSAAVAGVPNFDVDPPADAARRLPTFQGRIGADVSFFGFEGVNPDDIGQFWLVFEEPPAGYRFANDVATATAPADWAAEAFARPVRVLIRGDLLVPGHTG